MKFSGKVALITGASSGIGAATAELFAKEGASLALVGRNVENLKKTGEDCKKVNPSAEILLITADVTKDVERIVKETLEKYGKIHILVNNAGILAYGGILESDLDEFDTILNTNLRSVYHLTKLVAPHLIETQGNIVNVSSVAGLRSFTGAITYGISKAGLDQLTKCCSLDLASKKVRVNSVNPGVVVTDIHKRGGMTEEDYVAYLERSKGTHAMGRVGHVSEVASTIAFLASDDASFITGALVPVDGGKSVMCPR
ncbi:hypothetical protein ACFFRR_006726 [Megaselia abdita]